MTNYNSILKLCYLYDEDKCTLARIRLECDKLMLSGVHSYAELELVHRIRTYIKKQRYAVSLVSYVSVYHFEEEL